MQELNLADEQHRENIQRENAEESLRAAAPEQRDARKCTDISAYCGFARDYQYRFSHTEGSPKPKYPPLPDAEAHNALGIVYSEKGEHARAIELFTKAIELRSDEQRAFWRR